MQSSILNCHNVYLAKTHTEAQNRFLDFSLSVTTWPVSRGVGRVPPHYKNSHCSYVNIYISWKRKVNFNSLVWKFRSIILTFLLLSNSLLFAHCCCYSKMVEIVKSYFCIKSQLEYFNSLKQQRQCAKTSGFDNSCKKIEEKWA